MLAQVWLLSVSSDDGFVAHLLLFLHTFALAKKLNLVSVYLYL